MDVDLLEIEVLVDSDGTSFECVQIAPLPDDRCAVLFCIADPDYIETFSIIFLIDGFDPAKAETILLNAEWLMSLVATDAKHFLSLEATTRIWRNEGQSWSDTKISNIDLQRIWVAPDDRVFAIGRNGHSMVLVDGTWQAIKAGSPHQLHDISGANGVGIFSCGSEGTLQRLTDDGWEVIDLCRSDLFRGVCVSMDGTLRLAAGNGVCLEVRNLEEVVLLDAPATTFFTVAEYKGDYYWGDEAGVYIQDERSIKPLYDTGFAFDFRTDSDYLYCVGTDRAWRFDGENWLSLRLIFEDDLGFSLVLE